MRRVWRNLPICICNRNRHEHTHQIILSKKELIYQLDSCSDHSNLLLLLALGERLPDYSQRLTCAALKFAFTGSMVYPKGAMETEKPELRKYFEHLFEGFYESLEEVGQILRVKLKLSLSDDEVKSVFRKLLFVIATCCPCMADTAEMWWACTYHALIEYAINHDFPQYHGCNSIRDVYNSKITSRSHVIDSLLPKDLAIRIVSEDHLSEYINIRQ